MLQDRFRKWDRSKNVQSREMKAILYKLLNRERAHKRSEVRVRGMPVSITKVKRYQRMDSPTLHDELNRIKSPTPPTLEIHTPPASLLATPRSLRIPEELMKCIRDYTFGAFEEKIWVSSGDLEHVKSGGEVDNAIVEISEIIYLALELSKSSSSDALQALTRVKRLLENAIRSQDVRLLQYLFRCIPPYSRCGKTMLILPIFESCSSIAIEILGSNHPLARCINLMYLILAETENSSLMTVIGSAWINAVNSIEFVLGPLHFTSLEYRLDYTSECVINRDLGHGLSILRQLLRRYDEECCAVEDLRPFSIRLQLAFYLCSEECAQFQEAGRIATEIIRRTQQPGFPWTWILDYQSEAYYILSISQVELGQYRAGRKSMREAIRINVAAFGVRDARALNLKIILEGWLRRWGRVGAADVLQKQGLADLTSDDDDSTVTDEEGPEMPNNE